MHRINFCANLCLPTPVEGYDARGIRIVHEFPEAVLLPMAGAAAPLHVLYASKPATLEGKVLNPSDLDTKEKVDAVADTAIAPDFAVDLNPKYDALVANRDENLKMIAKALLEEGCDRVVIWSNNGIGRDANGDEDGILRDESGIAYATRFNGEVKPFYQKGLTGSHQNTAHDHIHIAPDTTGFGSFLTAELLHHHELLFSGTFQQARELLVSDAYSAVPCVSVAVLDYHTDLSRPIMNTFYRLNQSELPEGTKEAGYLRALVTRKTEASGIIISDKAVRKEHIERTAKFYRELLG